MAYPEQLSREVRRVIPLTMTTADRGYPEGHNLYERY